MPVDCPVVGVLGLLGHTIECIPDEAEILTTAREAQLRLVLQTDKKRASSLLLSDDPARDRYLDRLGMLA